MEEFISELFKSQGVWAALFVFFLLYTIRRNDKLDESQCEREREYQKMIRTDKNVTGRQRKRRVKQFQYSFSEYKIFPIVVENDLVL